MALTQPSLFLYGFDITNSNAYIDFQNASGGPVLTAIIPVQSYTLTDLITAIQTAFASADTSNTYTVSVNRNIAGGLQNRITITSSGSYFRLLFSSGPHASSSPASLLGFNAIDYTGATTYIGASSAGTILVSLYPAYNWVGPTRNKKTVGAVNISVGGLKEAVTFVVQVFWEAEFKYEVEEDIDDNWQPLFDWMVQQKPIEFTPEFGVPNTFYEGTLESTEEDSTGLAYQFKEMIPEFPGIYRTGKLTFRQTPTSSEFD